MDEQRELASDLLRSPVRIEILQHLRERSATRYELRDTLDCSRTTVDRNLESLHEDGWITRASDGYELTTAGEIISEETLGYLRAVGAAARLQPVLRWIPRDAFDLDVGHLSDADVVVATESQPMAMVDRHVQAVRRSPEMRMVTPIFSPQPMEAQFRNFTPEELEVEVIVTPAVASTFVSDPAVADRIAKMHDVGAIDIFVTDEPIPYFVGVLAESVQIGVDEDGQPRGLVESTAEAVREWATEKFAAYKRSAVPLERWADSET